MGTPRRAHRPERPRAEDARIGSQDRRIRRRVLLPDVQRVKVARQKSHRPGRCHALVDVLHDRFTLAIGEAIGVVGWIPAYRIMKVLFCAWMVNPRFKGAITLYKKGIQPIFHQLSPSIDKHAENLKKGDFAAIQQELGPQFAKVQELVKKHGPEAIERAMNLAGKGDKKNAATAANGTKAE